jgi:hypothetical protein
MTLEQTKKTALDSTTLEDIFSSWYNKVDSQSDSFKKHAKRLKTEELALYDSITTLESLNQYSERVIQDYGTSLGTMQELAKQQEYLMSALDRIEDDIDDVLRKKSQGSSGVNRLRGMFGLEEYQPIERGNYRQQMFSKSHAVNTTLDKIEENVSGLSKMLSVNNSESALATSEESAEIGKILNNSYESLRWIQDTACDLNYQIELLDRELAEL